MQIGQMPQTLARRHGYGWLNIQLPIACAEKQQKEVYVLHNLPRLARTHVS